MLVPARLDRLPRSSVSMFAHDPRSALRFEATPEAFDSCSCLGRLTDPATSIGPVQPVQGSMVSSKHLPMLSTLLAVFLRVVIVIYACVMAFTFRAWSLEEYGRLIHEFDPWFNYRAAEYLHQHGREKFFTWFDHMSWYPLGRPVGTTIYPGMQFTAVGIFHVLRWAGMPMSLNDVCCFVPCWFGILASLFTGLLTYECSGSTSAGAAGVLVMSIIPAHLMRTIGGGYDNESVAIMAFSALAYFYMTAAWGGYVFVVNMVAFHAALLLVTGKFSPKLYKAYTIFYGLGTLLAIQVPVVSWTPLKSMEQVAPLALFLLFQLLQCGEMMIKRKGLDKDQAKSFRLNLMIMAGVAVTFLFFVLGSTGVFMTYLFGRKSDGNSFIILYFFTAIYFANKMSRLIILMGPVSAALSGVALGMTFDWAIATLAASAMRLRPEPPTPLEADPQAAGSKASGSAVSAGSTGGGREGKQGSRSAVGKGKERMREKSKGRASSATENPSEMLKQWWEEKKDSKAGSAAATFLALLFLAAAPAKVIVFYQTAAMFAQQISSPKIVFKATTHQGEQILVTDYVDGYNFLKEHTPPDARILAWWDYGYQITGIGNRTTLADGNTWNQAHIALIGKMLTSSEDKAHKMIKHMADYVLVWSGGGSDDLAKSPHLARIATSIFPKHCGDDATCRHFGFYDSQRREPTPMMSKSLLYKLVATGAPGYPDVKLNPDYWELVYQGRYGKIRIYKVKGVDQESRRWLADPANRLCDRPGSWYCPGQYPPAIRSKLPPHMYQT
eukprot:gene23253-30480_t